MASLSGVDAVVVAVMHKEYTRMGLEGIAGLCAHDKPIVVDVKNALDGTRARSKGIIYWSL
jgi:UDP-N-acetyl-D-galactosamine dehydrogenase